MQQAEYCRAAAARERERAGLFRFENSIRFGLLAIRNLGRGLIQRILSERTMNGPFTTFYDFCKRMQGRDLNRRAVESLIRCGAFDGLGNNRREMLMAVGPLLDQLEDDKRRNIEGQIGLFDFGGEEKTESFEMPKAEEFPNRTAFYGKGSHRHVPFRAPHVAVCGGL